MFRFLSPRILLVCSIAVLSIAAMLLLVDTVPPRSLTHAHMHMMKRRILRYAGTHDALPTSIEQLPRIDGFANEVTDGWGRAILWQIKDGEFTLISYGRDGMAGGDGEDADMIAVFRVKTEDGVWADEFCEWQIDPFGRGK